MKAQGVRADNWCIAGEVFAVAAVVVILDQLSKAAVEGWLEYGARVNVIPYVFDLTLTYNRGAAFGLLAEVEGPLRPILLWTFTGFALLLVGYLLAFDYWHDRWGRASLALVCGGAFGNVIDRFYAGHVTDFFLVYWDRWHWPAFNIADSAICIGIALLILHPPHKDRRAGKDNKIEASAAT